MTNLPEFDYQPEDQKTTQLTNDASNADQEVKKTGANYLKADPEIPGQKWFVVSFLRHENLTNSQMELFKVRGSYETYEEAAERAAFVHSLEPAVDVFINNVGRYCPLRPDPLDCENVLYDDPKLTELMKEQKKSEQRRKQSKIDEMNEYAKSYYDQLSKDKEEYKERVKSKIREGIVDSGTLPYAKHNEQKPESDFKKEENKQVNTKQIRQKPKTRQELTAAARERCLRKLEKEKEKNNSENKNSENKQHEQSIESKINMIKQMVN